MRQRRRTPPLKSLEKALRILGLFGPHAPHLSLAEISHRLALNRTVAYRLLVSLEAHEYLERAPDGGYRVGKRAFELGSLYLLGNPLVERARPVLDGLVRMTGWTAQFSILDETEMLVLATRESQAMVRVAAEVGVRMPLHATAAGKVLMAYLPDETVGAIARSAGLSRFTARTITTLPALRRELARIRRQGYAIHDGEWTEGLFAVGAPVHTAEGVVGAIVTAAPSSLAQTASRKRAIGETVQAAGRLSTGYRGVDAPLPAARS